MLKGTDITVLGGGVGGLSAAIALAQKGARVTVLEQAPVIKEVGAGLQISPNGVRVLDALGLGSTLRKLAQKSRGVQLKDGISGKPVLDINFVKQAPDDDFLMIHRADLIDIFVRAALQLGVVLRTGIKVLSIEPNPNMVRIEVENGNAITTRFLVGADGVYSRARNALDAPTSPKFTGQVAWRALLPNEQELPEIATIHLGPGRHLVTYPIRNHAWINIVAVEERDQWVGEGWSARDDPKNLMTAFSSYARESRQMLAQVRRVSLWGLHQHPVAQNWHNGAAVLLGDAAHPTLPFMAQGSVMAIEDAWVLAASLDRAGLEDGPALYQSIRKPRVSKIVDAANKNARNYHYANPLARFAGFNALRVAGKVSPQMIYGRFRWIYDADVTREFNT